MDNLVRSKIVKIGNSRGIRIPRTLLEQAGLVDEVEMKVEGNQLIILSAHRARTGWNEQFAAMADHKDDQLLDETISTQWDEEEWTWS